MVHPLRQPDTTKSRHTSILHDMFFSPAHAHKEMTTAKLMQPVSRAQCRHSNSKKLIHVVIVESYISCVQTHVLPSQPIATSLY